MVAVVGSVPSTILTVDGELAVEDEVGGEVGWVVG